MIEKEALYFRVPSVSSWDFYQTFFYSIAYISTPPHTPYPTPRETPPPALQQHTERSGFTTERRVLSVADRRTRLTAGT